ncbi:MAG: hypothetical protein JKY93_06470, partial [Gammaproteobacteria bacterium]|nr:hypothetical protein [Gammaproteobacteria bacterium]
MKKLLFILLISILGISVSCSFIKPLENSQVLPYKKDIIDYHIHVAGLGHGNSGCFINKSMRDNFRFKFYLKAMGTSVDELEKHGDQIIFSKISTAIDKSKVISHGVILALDGVITDGQLDHEKTQVYVPSHYVYQQTQKYNNLLYAASINPYRSDAIPLLEKAKQQ